MPKYLAIADKVYKKIKNDNLFSDDVIENLNCLVGLIRNAIKGTEFKLKYNFINFEDCLTKPIEQCSDPSQNNGQYFPLKIT